MALLIVILLATLALGCPPGFTTYFNGRCLSLVTPPAIIISYESAIQHCDDNYHSIPASVHSASENDFLMQQLVNYNRHDAYIGLQCDGRNFYWYDGTSFDYSPIGYTCSCGYTYCMNHTSWEVRSGSDSWVSAQVFCEIPKPAGKCDAFLEAAPGNCYMAYNENKKNSDAEKDCEEQAAYLASIHSDSDNSFVRRTATAAGITTEVAIGATASGSSWYWNDGSAKNYSNWASGYPNSNYGNCVLMRITSGDDNGKWINYNCNTKMPYVCGRNYNTALHETKPCTSNVFTTGASIYSPGFPTVNLTNCDYTIEVASNKKAAIEIVYLNTNLCCDSLHVDEHDNTIIKKLGGFIAPGTVYKSSKSNIMYLKWRPTSGVDVEGFHVKVIEK